MRQVIVAEEFQHFQCTLTIYGKVSEGIGTGNRNLFAGKMKDITDFGQQRSHCFLIKYGDIVKSYLFENISQDGRIAVGAIVHHQNFTIVLIYKCFNQVMSYKTKTPGNQHLFVFQIIKVDELVHGRVMFKNRTERFRFANFRTKITKVTLPAFESHLFFRDKIKTHAGIANRARISMYNLNNLSSLRYSEISSFLQFVLSYLFRYIKPFSSEG